MEDGRGPDGKFAPGHAGSGGRPPGIPDPRSAEIEAICKEVAESQGGFAALLTRFLLSENPKVAIEALKLTLAYAYGLPRQRIAVESGATAIVLTWPNPAASAPAAPLGAAGDPVQPGALPCRELRPALGQEPDGGGAGG